MRGLLTSILTILTFTGIQAQALPEAPKLVIALTIDQLRTDYIEAFSSLYGEDGFKKVWRDGVVYKNIYYPFINSNRASAVASLYSGTVPANNGIISSRWLNSETLNVIGAVDDHNYMGNYTEESSSPSNLLVSTLTDELKIASQAKSLVYSIAPFRDIAILAAGHNADGAFWLNDKTGKWCSSTYYKEFPWWVSEYNDKKAIDFRIEDLVWTPQNPPEKYNNWNITNVQEDFKYKLDHYGQNKFRRFKSTPYVNDEVNNLLKELFEYSRVGKNHVPDFLSLTYYAGDYTKKINPESSTEIQDAYVRLDRTLAELFRIVDAKIGLNNVMFVITGTTNSNLIERTPSKYNVPTGEFRLNRCSALLNVYLMATYGNGKYVDGFYNQNIYLNHKLIEKKHIDLAELQNKAASFLSQFSGVKNVFSADLFLSGKTSNDILKIKNTYCKDRSGDLFIDVLPGWSIVDDSYNQIKTVHHGYVPVPLIILQKGISSNSISTPIDVRCVAPTVARSLRIRAPNSSSSQPLYFNK